MIQMNKAVSVIANVIVIVIVIDLVDVVGVDFCLTKNRLIK